MQKACLETRRRETNVIMEGDELPSMIKKHLETTHKSLQVVKHVVKGEKWACSTLEAGKDKPIDCIAKTRDFKRFSEEIKENRRFD